MKQKTSFAEYFLRITDIGLKCPKCNSPIYHARGKADPQNPWLTRQAYACQCIGRTDVKRLTPLRLDRWEKLVEDAIRYHLGTLPGVELPGPDFVPNEKATMQRSGIYDPSIGAAKSKSGRWREAARIAQEALEELIGVREEYENWKDNLPENLAESETAQQLQEICDLNLEDALELIEEAKQVELPRGFGKPNAETST